MDAEMRERLDRAAERALRRHPGPVGELLHREFRAYLHIGHRYDDGRRIRRLADAVLGPESGPAVEDTGHS